MRFTVQQLAGYPGAFTLYAVNDNYPAPVGFIWYRFPLLNTLELLYVFVHEHHRQQGVATVMLKYLRDNFTTHVIAGAVGTPESSNWMTKNGFEQTNNGWFLYPKEN